MPAKTKLKAIDSSYDSDEDMLPHNLRHCIPYAAESPSSSSAQHRPSFSQTYPTMSLSNPLKWVFPKRFPRYKAHLCIRHMWRVNPVKTRLSLCSYQEHLSLELIH
jgi:hypothetical protein